MTTKSMRRMRGAGVAAATAALALLLAGCAGTTPAATTTTPAPGTGSTGAASASPTPTGTPTAASAPTVRVPATCDELQPVPAGFTPVETQPTGDSPADYAAARAGVLQCAYSDAANVTLTFSVTPDVSAEDYSATADGVDFGPLPAAPAIGPDAREECPLSSRADLCQFIDLENGYGITATAYSGDQGTALPADVVDGFAAAVPQLAAAVTALGAPEPLWHPSGADLPGAVGCENLISDARLNEILGTTKASAFKTDDGEYARFPFRVSKQVGSEWCLWGSETDAGAGASVLPGGASYLPAAMAASERYDWQPAPEYPGEAYIATQEGSPQSTVDLAIDDAWVQVSGPVEVLPALVDEVLGNVGAVVG
ncbi:hypothetical protein ITJ64_16610 [Herbiconiux sp. VKM Ac-1786]|uniref:hypothetical protein n=1 Tax=Herbiconiux sp. VKM Ac-1786 TaxID=2783824 RepID=UPI00188B64D3|nr:hypothetical protein [Herbiconiux sp. VKM Ac-1786]MBF4574136.1 hypothetical protein [Herbiconiux sp. VKM Ac-1786]